MPAREESAYSTAAGYEDYSQAEGFGEEYYEEGGWEGEYEEHGEGEEEGEEGGYYEEGWEGEHEFEMDQVHFDEDSVDVDDDDGESDHRARQEVHHSRMRAQEEGSHSGRRVERQLVGGRAAGGNRLSADEEQRAAALGTLGTGVRSLGRSPKEGMLGCLRMTMFMYIYMNTVT